MLRIDLDIDDPANRLTLKVMLETTGHHIEEHDPQVIISDSTTRAIAYAKKTPTLVLASASQVPAAVAAMRQGVYGYLFIPFQPGEAELMVQRAAEPKNPERSFDPITLDEAKMRHTLAALRHCKNNQARAARLLGIGRNTLWRMLKRK